MESFLQTAVIAVIGAMAGEFCLCMLPTGGTRKFCRFIVGLVLVLILLSAPLNIDETQLNEILQTQQETVLPNQNKSYEEMIWDVYNEELENKNK